jgi:hypothetical protein
MGLGGGIEACFCSYRELDDLSCGAEDAPKEDIQQDNNADKVVYWPVLSVSRTGISVVFYNISALICIYLGMYVGFWLYPKTGQAVVGRLRCHKMGQLSGQLSGQ